MSATARTDPSAGRPDGAHPSISIRDAVITWLAAWMFGAVASSAVISGGGSTKIADAGAGWIAAAQLAAWLPLVGAIVFTSRTRGSGSLRRDVGLAIRPIDLLGVPLGIVTQIGLVRGLYELLQRVWPDTFDMHKVEQPARDIWANAHGAGVVVIVLVVVVGAPLVEELTYRGLLQGAFTRCSGAVSGVLLVAVWFAVIHFQTVNIPGLALVGLVLGIAALRTGRIGMSILTHMAFNATGLVMIAVA